ncbi:MAG TPA: hypothetical protein VJL60_05080, partial [Gammaproteobacteria bacterium]|nr:hypothetical protein [Gammaproteobacteria bacterium]
TQTSTLMIAPPVQEADASETSVPTQQTFTKPVVVAPTSPAATGFVKRPASMAKVTYKVMPVYSKTSS